MPAKKVITLTKKQKDELIEKYGHIPTEEEVVENIRASSQKVLTALAAAWDSAPDDPKIKADIVKALKKALDLRKKIEDTIEKKSTKG